MKKMLVFYLLILLHTSLEAAKDATDSLSFDVEYIAELPKLEPEETGEVWVPLAPSNPFQKVTRQITAPAGEITVDRDFGNEFYHLKYGSKDGSPKVAVRYRVTRKEKAPYPVSEKSTALFLRAENLIPVDERFKKIAGEVTQGKQTPLEKGRAIYDHVLKTMKYDKSGTRWGRGDAIYACDAKTGNCTDFHALFIAIARAAGIPSRFAIGFTIPTEKAEGSIEGYHCWAEFLSDDKWIPVDISEAWKERENPRSVEYYFGHHPANRFEISQGRDLFPKIATSDGPINFIVHPYLEINGKTRKYQGHYKYKTSPMPNPQKRRT